MKSLNDQLWTELMNWLKTSQELALMDTSKTGKEPAINRLQNKLFTARIYNGGVAFVPNEDRFENSVDSVRYLYKT